MTSNCVCVCMCVDWADTCMQPSCSSIFWKGPQKQRVCLCWWDGAAGTSQLFCGCHLWQKGSWQKASKSFVNHSSGLFLINQEAFCSAQGSFALAMSLKSYKGIHDLKQMECFHRGIPSPKFWTEPKGQLHDNDFAQNASFILMVDQLSVHPASLYQAFWCWFLCFHSHL